MESEMPPAGRNFKRWRRDRGEELHHHVRTPSHLTKLETSSAVEN